MLAVCKIYNSNYISKVFHLMLQSNLNHVNASLFCLAVFVSEGKQAAYIFHSFLGYKTSTLDLWYLVENGFLVCPPFSCPQWPKMCWLV